MEMQDSASSPQLAFGYPLTRTPTVSAPGASRCDTVQRGADLVKHQRGVLVRPYLETDAVSEPSQETLRILEERMRITTFCGPSAVSLDRAAVVVWSFGAREAEQCWHKGASE